MRASVTASIPHHGADRNRILSLEGFIAAMDMVEKIANKEISDQYEKFKLVKKKIVKDNVKFLYNVGKRKPRTAMQSGRLGSIRVSGASTDSTIWGQSTCPVSEMGQRLTWDMETNPGNWNGISASTMNAISIATSPTTTTAMYAGLTGVSLSGSFD